DSKAFDGEGTSGFGKSDQYALALTARVHLTSDRPCAITQAQAVTHQGFRYRHETVPASLHYNFSAGGLYLNKKGGITNDMKGPAGDAAQIGLLSGTPISDVGDVYRATEDL
ncbi:hypothetical protein, partial [Novosphingobium sp.]